MKKIFVAMIAMLLVLAGCTGGASEKEIKLHRSYEAAHGDKAFTRVVVALDGDKIIDVAIDEFQVFDAGNMTAVPNSDGAFGAGFVEGKVLGSKFVNDEAYSKNMTDKAGATKQLYASMGAIVDYAKGKTVADLEKVVADNEAGKPVDAISGSTLVDTVGYLQAIVNTIKNTAMVSSAKVAVDTSKVTLGQAVYAAHGDKSFADVVVAMADGKVVVANIDEYQFVKGATGVPNSDKGFGENYADAAAPLSSKLVNAEAYSKNMTDKGGATKTLVENFKAIEDYVVNKTVEELTKLAADNPTGKPVDAISGSTLVDTSGYVSAIVEAAKAVK